MTPRDVNQYATAESRRRGALRAAEAKRERSKTFRQRLGEKLDERAEEIVEQLLAAGEHDWRALIALIHEAYGRPAQAVELTAVSALEIEGAQERLARRLAGIADTVRARPS